MALPPGKQLDDMVIILIGVSILVVLLILMFRG